MPLLEVEYMLISFDVIFMAFRDFFMIKLSIIISDILTTYLIPFFEIGFMLDTFG